MKSLKYSLTLALSCCVAALVLASCGGGGTATTVDAGLVISTSTDASTAVLAGTDTGLWDGAGGGGGSDGGGGAGDGEFLQFNFKPTSATTAIFSWTVLNSQYGIKGQTGSMSLTADSFGGYKVAGGPILQQGNIYVSKTGQVTGSVPLQIGATTVYMIFNGTRYKDTVADLTQVAGDYFYGASFRRASDGLDPSTEYGTLRIRADGTARICSVSAYSDTCASGFDLKVAVDNPSDPKVLKFTTSDYRNLLGYAVGKKNSSGKMTSSMDISYSNQSGQRYTGSVYSMQMSGSYNPNAYPGSWAGVGTDPSSGVRNASTGFLRINSGGTSFNQHDTSGGTNCTVISNPSRNDQGSMGNASTFPGIGFAQSSPPNTGFSYIIPMSDNFLVAISATSTGGLALIRRYKTLSAPGNTLGPDCP